VLGLAQTFEEPGLPQPRRLVLISPWLDLTLSNPDLPAVEARDPWLSIAGTREAGTAWADGDDPTDPQLSPLNGPLDEPLDGLPPSTCTSAPASSATPTSFTCRSAGSPTA
jgi:acetyl esterase/lipase